MTEWEKECAFWDDPARPETFELEYSGGYGGGYFMAQQMPGSHSHGEWIRADDYRAEVERLQARVSELEADIVVWRQQQQARLDRREY
jgi:hypothetical protein